MPFADAVSWGVIYLIVSDSGNTVTYETMLFEHYEELGFELSILYDMIDKLSYSHLEFAFAFFPKLEESDPLFLGKRGKKKDF